LSVIPRLDSFQRDVLDGFFRRESRFFLTGGAALAGFHLGHRETKDLDLFTTGDFLEDGVAALREAANELAASVEAIRTAPDFRRFLLRRGTDSVIVDLVKDSAPQLFPEKPTIGTVRVDALEEILANKLCALLSRGEIRDLVDVRALELAGLHVEEMIGPAVRKDGGLTPGQLAWVLSQIEIGEDAVPPGGVTAAALRVYLRDLERRLTALALPR
jgi:hypothetical protein